jgi:hypothetical protein
MPAKRAIVDLGRAEKTLKVSIRLTVEEQRRLGVMTAQLGGDTTGTIRMALNRMWEYLESKGTNT